jgi:hypothetical protein
MARGRAPRTRDDNRLRRDWRVMPVPMVSMRGRRLPRNRVVASSPRRIPHGPAPRRAWGSDAPDAAHARDAHAAHARARRPRARPGTGGVRVVVAAPDGVVVVVDRGRRRIGIVPHRGIKRRQGRVDHPSCRARRRIVPRWWVVRVGCMRVRVLRVRVV